MGFLDVVERVRAYLERNQRMSLAALRREFELDDEALDSLVDELVHVQGVASREGQVISWRSAATPSDSLQSPPAQADRRQLTIMFCDLVGSTELSQMLDPEDLREINRAYQDVCKTAIDRYGGYVAQYLGDGVLAYFGYPQAHEDSAERGVLSGLAVVDAMTRLNGDIGQRFDIEATVRIGLATGPVVVGDLIGEGASQQSAVVGQTPNLAARLQGIAAPNTVVISAETYALIRDRFSCENLGEHSLKGISEPVHVWCVRDTQSAHTRFAAGHNTTLFPMIGREHELGLLLSRWQNAQEGSGQVVLLSGEAGIGKSRVVEALREEALRVAPLVIQYQCSSHHSDTALYPVARQLELAAGLEPGDSVSRQRQRLDEVITSLGEIDGTGRSLLAELLSIPVDHSTEQLPASAEKRRELTLEALLALVEAAATRHCVLLLFEDLHWADATSVEWLGLLISRIANVPAMVVATHRPEFDPPWGTQVHVTSLALNRLARGNTFTLVEQISSGRQLPDEVLAKIVERTDGVPLFVEELTKMVLESDRFAGAGDHTRTSDTTTSIGIPSSLHDSLMARLDRVASVRDVAQTAAVIGREFTVELLAKVLSLTAEALDAALDSLVEGELVFPLSTTSGRRYIFKHALVQEAAYQSLLNSKRQQLHGDLSRVLEREFPGIRETQPEIIAHHFTEAGNAEEAARYLLKAGRRAIRAGAHVEAIAHIQRGLTLLDTTPESPARDTQEVSLRVALGVPLLSERGAASISVGDNYRRAQSLSERIGDSEHLFPALWGEWIHHFLRSDMRRAMQLADRLIALVGDQSDVEASLSAHHCQWASRLVVGEPRTALYHGDHGIEIYCADDHHHLAYTYGGHDPGVCAFNVSGLALWVLGHPEEAQRRLDDALQLARDLNHSATTADSMLVCLQVSCLQQDMGRVRQQSHELLALSAAEKFQGYEPLATGLIGWVEWLDGDAESGLERMRAAVEDWVLEGTAWTVAPATLVADTLGRVGREDEGLDLIADYIARTEREGVHWCDAELHRVRGELLAQADGKSSSAARDAFERAIETARRQDARSFELRAATNLGELLDAEGDKEAATAVLTSALEVYPGVRDSRDLLRAKSMLAELGA